MYNMEYRIEAGEMAPDFRLRSTAGRDVRLYDCKNKKIVLLFFSTTASRAASSA